MLSMIGHFIKFLGSARMRWCALGLTATLFLFAHAPHTRLLTDAAAYSAISRAMADTGDYLNLRLGDQPYYNKPPLQFWLAALSIQLLGPTVVAVTLFSRLFALGCVFLTAWLGRRLYNVYVGWVAGLALTTSYIFFRGSATFRLDSALTFGILLSFCAYLSAAKKWAPPVFFLGIAIGILSKGPPALLPLLVVPFHAYFDSDRATWNKPQILRWAAWSPLLLLPFCWWLYLLLADGTQPFDILFDDLVRAKVKQISGIESFWINYIQLAFLKYYWPWLPFALWGGWILIKEFRRPEPSTNRRASAALILAWIGIATLSCAFKNAQYPRYVFFALPAVSILTGRGLMRLMGERCFEWLQGTIAAFAVVGAFTIACFGPFDPLPDNARYYAIKEILDERLPPRAPLPMIKLKPGRDGNEVELSKAERSTSLFFFDRPLRLITLDEARQAAAKDRLTLLLRSNEVEKVKASLPLEILFSGPYHVVVDMPRRAPAN